MPTSSKEYLLALDGLLDDLESQVWSRSTAIWGRNFPMTSVPYQEDNDVR